MALVLRLFGMAMPGATAPTLVHATAMLYAFLPIYRFGFLFTAGPSWLGVKGPDAPALLATALLAFAGGGLLIVLSILSMPASGIPALVLCACWTRFVLIFWGLIRKSTVPDRKHSKLVRAFMLPGIAGVAGYALLCFGENMRWYACAWILAPLHAATMGFVASILFAMVTRVTCGHSGRPLVADDVTWRLFWLLQTATLLRQGAELWPQGYAWLVTAAILAWLAAFAGWAWKYVPAYLRPRADGKLG